MSQNGFYKAHKKFGLKWDYKTLRFLKLGERKKLEEFIVRFNKSSLSLMDFLKQEKIHSHVFYRRIESLGINYINKKTYIPKINKFILNGNILKKIGDEENKKKGDKS